MLGLIELQLFGVFINEMALREVLGSLAKLFPRPSLNYILTPESIKNHPLALLRPTLP